MKYLIIMVRGCECSIVFNPILDHADVAGDQMEVISAGFCRMPNYLNDNAFAYGESVSLKIKSRGQEDARVIFKDVMAE